MYRDTTAACDAATYGSVFLKALHFAPKELLTFHSEQGIQYFPISLAEKRKKGRWTRLLYTLCVCARAGIGIFVILQYMYYFPLLVFFFPQGPSEWYYAFVPIVGPLIGGSLGAAAFYGCIQLNDYPDWFEGETSTFGGSWEL